ncbi:MFS transporter [Comamonas composti]|uniref:MFS transporter n=1 Tax=Comamonas composti TaxID=408558 RepID=UPI00040B9CE6|nr:MFS transporter [Comamonas composti]
MNLALLKLITAQVCVHATMAGMRLAAPLLALKQGHSAVAVGFLLALFALTQVFMALPAGRYADRAGFRKPFFLAMLAASGGSGLALLLPSYPALCVAALLTGGASGMVVIAVQRHAGRIAHDALALKKVFSWLAIGPAVSNFLGPFLTGLLIDYANFGGEESTMGFRMAFVLLALAPVLAWSWVRSTQELPPVRAPAGGPKAQAWDLLRERGFRQLLLVNWLQSASWDVHTFVLPLLGHEKGISASVIGTLLGVFAVAATVIRLLMPLVAERLREGAVVAGAMLVSACVFAAYPLMDSAWTMGICSMLLGFSLGSVQPMVMSMLHQITPEHRHGEALGLRLMLINASSVAMPVLSGAVGSLIGVASLFWIMGAGMGSCLKPAWRLGLSTKKEAASAGQ